MTRTAAAARSKHERKECERLEKEEHDRLEREERERKEREEAEKKKRKSKSSSSSSSSSDDDEKDKKKAQEEQERREKEERERREREQLEKEEHERREREQLEKEEHQRRERERLEKEEHERRERERLEKEEHERRERERLEKEAHERREKEKKTFLDIRVISASNIPVGDVFSSDPYVLIKYGSQKDLKTKTISNTLEPAWNEDFSFKIQPSTSLRFLIYDEDTFTAHEFLGEYEISHDTLMKLCAEGKPVTHELGNPHKLPIEVQLRGTITLLAKYR